VNEFREYENGVADVLAFIFGAHAEVKRNVLLPVRGSSRRRQIDVLARVHLHGLTTLTLIVDCKLHTKKADVGELDKFIGLVDDVQADMGILMTSSGEGKGARDRASSHRGIQVATLTMEELRAWSPQGTMNWRMRINSEDEEPVTKKLRDAGFRVSTKERSDNSEVIIELLRHSGEAHPSGDVQVRYRAEIESAFEKIDVPYVPIGSGVTVGGGTPAHRWLEVTIDGMPSGTKVVAASERDVESQLDMLADLGLRRASLDVIRPEGWPLPGLFGLRGLPLELLKSETSH
jgi:hypothetical protein